MHANKTLRAALAARAALARPSPRPRRRSPAATSSFAADAHLKIWVRGQKAGFDSFGAGRPADGGLGCEGSLSAAEADSCKTNNDGVHRDCRIGAATSGAFAVATRPDGLMVTILRRLELVPEPFDGGPFLYLSPGNAENHAFALKPAPDASCK